MAITFTAQQLIARAAALVGVAPVGDSLSNANAQFCLPILNGFLDTLGTQRLALPASERDVFNLTAGQQTYTIGPSGDWDITRPVQIDQMNVLRTPGDGSDPFEIPLGALDDQSYGELSIKTLTADFPFYYYYNATAPLGSIFLWPEATDVTTNQIVLYAPTQLVTFATLQTSATMAPGYYRMLYYNAAVEIGLGYGKPIEPNVLRLAQESLADVQRVNLQMLDLQPGAELPGTAGIYNIYGDLNY